MRCVRRPTGDGSATCPVAGVSGACWEPRPAESQAGSGREGKGRGECQEDRKGETGGECQWRWEGRVRGTIGGES